MTTAPVDDTLHRLVIARARAVGPLTYAAFMDLALYHPEHGYYRKPDRKTGTEGDYVTAPQVSPAFGRALATFILKCLDGIGERPFSVVEVGAGDGTLLSDVAAAITRRLGNGVRFAAVDKSEACLAAVKKRFGALGLPVPALYRDSAEIGAGFCGVVFSNELLDAMPVHVMVKSDRWREVFIAEQDGVLTEIERAPSRPELVAYVEDVYPEAGRGARVEVNLAALEWLEWAAHALKTGAVITIDYGGTSREILMRSGTTGTLRSFFRHTLGSPVLSGAGHKDITHSVNFSPLAARGHALGLSSLPLATQAVFLLANGVLEEAGDGSPEDAVSVVRARQALKTLVIPGAMGESFRVLVQGKGIALPPLSLAAI